MAWIAAAFFSRPVLVRFSDFKTNEYARLLGGQAFAPVEANPMLGFRGASGYVDERYRDAFALECAAVRKASERFGLRNIRVMIPLCRTLDERRRALAPTALAWILEEIMDRFEDETTALCHGSDATVTPRTDRAFAFGSMGILCFGCAVWRGAVRCRSRLLARCRRARPAVA